MTPEQQDALLGILFLLLASLICLVVLWKTRVDKD